MVRIGRTSAGGRGWAGTPAEALAIAVVGSAVLATAVVAGGASARAARGVAVATASASTAALRSSWVMVVLPRVTGGPRRGRHG
ncbi:MAG: hypothetical protein R2731_11745 [Nocardioides sp.]